MTEREQQKRKRKQRGKRGEYVTKAVTHIRLQEINPGKLAALDALAPIYLALCQEYVALFCTEEQPDKFHDPVFPTALSERWHRVAIQQAAGIAQSWWTNQAAAYQDYEEALAEYEDKLAEGALDEEAEEAEEEPVWQEWNIPTLQQICIQANVNVVKLEPSEDSTFDYWLKISTLEPRNVLLVPVKLADYHKEALTDPDTGERRPINSSVTLNKRDGAWWLTLSYDQKVTKRTTPTDPVIGIDVGIANFLTTSDGKHYGTFNGKLKRRHQRDREKRRRKAKLRACLEKKGVKKLPSTSSRTGERLIRHTRQSINRAVNECFNEHPDAQFAYEQLSAASMKFKARVMNAYLRASNLAHIPKQIAWNSEKRGVRATKVKSAYSSQECNRCQYVDRKNRPDQQTFCCQVCGLKMHADHNAATNIQRRLGDRELLECTDRREVKALLLRRHQRWREAQATRTSA